MYIFYFGYHISDKSTGGDAHEYSGGNCITPNGLSNLAAVPQSTIKSILNGESQNPGSVTIKKLCDAFEITLGQFYSTPEFDALEQEIK